MPASYEQLQARFRIDTAAVNTAATWGAALNAAWTRAPGADFRIRFTLQTTGTSGSAAASTENLFVSKNAGAYVAIGGTSGILPSATASSSADETAITTAQLSLPSGVFVNGIYDSSGATNSLTIPRGDYTEIEFGVKIDPANSAFGNTFDFRVYRGASVQSLYSNTPRITSTGINLASGSYLVNPGASPPAMILSRPNRTIHSDQAGAYSFKIANLVTTSVQGSTPINLAYVPFSYSGGPNTTLNYYATGGAGTPHPFPVAYATYAWTGPAYVSTSVISGRPPLYLDVGHYAWSPATQVTSSTSGATRNIPLGSGSYAWSIANQVTTGSGQQTPAGTGSYGWLIATLNVDHIVVPTPVSYSVTGVQVTFRRTAALNYGSYGITGYQVTFRRARFMALDNGPYTLSGPPLGFTRIGHYQMPLDGGAYALSGISPATKSARAMLLGYAAYTLSGRAINMFSARYFAAVDTGSYSLTGFSSILDYKSRHMTLAGGVYSVAGQGMSFKSGPRTLFATPPGIYGVVGPATVIKSNRNIQLGYGSYTLVGEPIPLFRAKIVSLTVGFYSTQGGQITVRRTYAPPIAIGLYSLSGPPMGLSKIGGHSLPIAIGPYTLTGASMAFKIARVMSIAGGSYTITGPSLASNIAHTLSLNIGFYTLTGQSIVAKRGHTSTLVGGTYTLTGEPITLAKNVHPAISLASGSYALTGPAMNFAKGRGIVLSGTLYSIAGQSITFKTGRAPMSIAGGTYALTGPAMTLKRSRVLVPNTGSYLTYGPSTIRLVGPGGKLGGQASAWPEILRRRRRA